MNVNAEKLKIRQLTKEDLAAFKQLIHLFNTVFEEAESAIGSETNLEKLLEKKDFIAMAAFFENEVVGGLTAYELSMYYSDDSEIFLYDLAVKAEFQRIGIGKRLIHALKDYCAANGIKEFFVLAHEEDDHAVEFYHSTGGKSEKVVNFLYEAGVNNDLSTRKP
jgi:aminoglycoside 3-N-acetyltransferase I